MCKVFQKKAPYKPSTKVYLGEKNQVFILFTAKKPLKHSLLQIEDPVGELRLFSLFCDLGSTNK